MWFDDDMIVRRGQSFRRGRNVSRNKLVLDVNTRRTGGRKEWVSRTGVILLALVGVGAAVVVSRVIVLEAHGVLFSRTPEYAMTNLVIECDNPRLKEYVSEQTPLSAGTNLFLIDIAGIQKKLGKTANVKSAAVYRRLPHTLEICLSERIPVARLGDAGDRSRYLVVDDGGVVFLSRSRSFAAGLPMITGYDRKKQTPGDKIEGCIEYALRLLDVCHTRAVGRIIEIAWIDIDRDRLEIGLSEGPVVFLAWKTDQKDELQDKDIENRLKVLCGVLRKAEQAGVSLQTVDLTHDNYANYCPTTPRWDRRN